MSKESLLNETSILNSVRDTSHIENGAISADNEKEGKTKGRHDDFSDIVDYVMLNSDDREKYRLDIDRIHPVILPIGEGDEMVVRYLQWEMKKITLE
ncbi:hypothetical protein JTB14_029815 [Gonioctena quinquepunctata]|nr:hypothetical protein JTB14_029815 [Gonioctena quinquepunctata]